jgi:hypothetical protein
MLQAAADRLARTKAGFRSERNARWVYFPREEFERAAHHRRRRFRAGVYFEYAEYAARRVTGAGDERITRLFAVHRGDDTQNESTGVRERRERGEIRSVGKEKADVPQEC